MVDRSVAGGLTEPLAAPLRRVLRRAVLHHAESEHRPVHLPLLHVGVPGVHEAVHPVRADEPADHALRADVVAALVRRAGLSGTPLVWLTRPGELVLQDVDAAWLAAAAQAFGEADLRLVYVVVNRHGWRDPRSGLEARWVRLRRRS